METKDARTQNLLNPVGLAELASMRSSTRCVHVCVRVRTGAEGEGGQGEDRCHARLNKNSLVPLRGHCRLLGLCSQRWRAHARLLGHCSQRWSAVAAGLSPKNKKSHCPMQSSCGQEFTLRVCRPLEQSKGMGPWQQRRPAMRTMM